MTFSLGSAALSPSVTASAMPPIAVVTCLRAIFIGSLFLHRQLVQFDLALADLCIDVAKSETLIRMRRIPWQWIAARLRSGDRQRKHQALGGNGRYDR